MFTSACSFVEADGTSVAFLGPGAQAEAPDTGDVHVTESSLFGVWMETDSASGKPIGAGIGYRAREVVAVPFECKAIFIVETDDQFAQAEAMIRDLKNAGDDICAVQK